MVRELGQKARALPQLHLKYHRQIAVGSQCVQMEKGQPPQALAGLGSFSTSVRAWRMNASKAVLMAVIRISSLFLK